MNIWRPRSNELALIMAAAAEENDVGLPVRHIALEPGYRYNTEDHDIPEHMNIARVTRKTGDTWGDTDLSCHGDWASFVAGIELTPDGRAVVDFYIRPRTNSLMTKHGTLIGNITVYYAEGNITRICGSVKDYLEILC